MDRRRRYTRYEKARIIGVRAMQVAYGAPVLVRTNRTEPTLIAAEEYDAGVLPFTVRRNGHDETEKSLLNRTSDSATLTVEEVYQSSIGRVDDWMFSLVNDSTDRTYDHIKVERDPERGTAALLWNTDLNLHELLRAVGEHTNSLDAFLPPRIAKLKGPDAESDLTSDVVADWIESFLIDPKSPVDLGSITKEVKLLELTAETDDFALFWAAKPFPDFSESGRYRVRFEFPVGAADSTVVIKMFEECAPDAIPDRFTSNAIHSINAKVENLPQ